MIDRCFGQSQNRSIRFSKVIYTDLVEYRDEILALKMAIQFQNYFEYSNLVC